MATNLRLRREAADAVRQEAERTGRSQQDVIREAVDRYLGLTPPTSPGDELDVLVTARGVLRPRNAYRKPARRICLPEGVTSSDLLDRQDRI
jgi:hypothetical protein